MRLIMMGTLLFWLWSYPTLEGGVGPADPGEPIETNRGSASTGLPGRGKAPGHQAWLIKLNDRGEVLWRRDYPDVAAIGTLRAARHGRILAAGAWGGLHKTTGRPWVALLDPEGHPLREHRLEGDGRDSPTGLESPEGGLVLIGEAWTREPKKAYDIYFRNILLGESQEEIHWFGWEGVENHRAAVSLPGGVVIAGRTWSQGAPPRAWLFRVDWKGRPVWSHFFAGKTNQVANALCTQPAGGLVVAIETMYPEKPQTRLVGVDDRGEEQWTTPYQDLSDPQVACGPSGAVFFSGSFDPSPPDRQTNKTWRVRVERLEPEGRIVWSREFRGLRGKALTATSDGGVLLAGWSTYYSASKNSVAQVLKLDQAGNPQWIKTIEGPTGDTALSLLEAANGGYLVGGRSGQGGL